MCNDRRENKHERFHTHCAQISKHTYGQEGHLAVVSNKFRSLVYLLFSLGLEVVVPFFLLRLYLFCFFLERPPYCFLPNPPSLLLHSGCFSFLSWFFFGLQLHLIFSGHVCLSRYEHVQSEWVSKFRYTNGRTIN